MSDVNINRRKYQRHTLSIKLFMTRVDDDSGLGIPIEVLDMSKSGIGFICEQELTNGAIYKANIKIWTGAVIPAFINVVRVSHEEGGNIYGGIFIGMPESDACRIGVYESYLNYGNSPENREKTEEEERNELDGLLNKALGTGN